MKNKEEQLRVLVVGAGSIGTYVAACLWLGGAAVKVSYRDSERGRLLVDEAHERGSVAVVHNGEACKVPAAGFFVAQDSTDEKVFLKLCDYVLIATKRTANAAVAEWFEKVDFRSRVVLLQNGLDATLDFKMTNISQCVVRIGVFDNGGVFTRTSGDGLMLAVGEERLAEALSHKPKLLSAWCCPALQAEINTKFVLNCAMNALSALADRPSPKMLISGSRTRRVALLAAAEAVEVCQKHEMPLKPASWKLSWALHLALLIDLILSLTLLPLLSLFFTPPAPSDDKARSSMWDDLNLGRKTENDFLNGKVVTLGLTGMVSTPINRALFRLIHQFDTPTGSKSKGTPNMTPAQLTDAVHRAVTTNPSAVCGRTTA